MTDDPRTAETQPINSTGIDKEVAYGIAVEQNRFQHQRWNQWALFYFGGIGGVFILRSQYANLLPLPCVSILACLMSAAWVFAALGIRKQNLAWEEVARKIEQSTNGNCSPFVEYTSEFAKQCALTEFIKSVRILQLHRDSLLRVSRHMILFGVIASVGFFVLGIGSIWCPPPSKESPGFATTTTTTTTVTGPAAPGLPIALPAVVQPQPVAVPKPSVDEIKQPGTTDSPSTTTPTNSS